MSEPSKVIHIRGVGPDVTEHDVRALTQQFGAVEKIVHLRSKNQILLQFEDIQPAIDLVQFYLGQQPSLRGTKVHVQFSSHKELRGEDSSPKRGEHQESHPNRILLITVHNPLYPITVDVLQQVFSPHGFVEKVVTFTKAAGLQALVQYSSQESALLARSALQGRNIYDGCCTLDIQFSNQQELQVNYNNDRTRDFTNNQLPEAPNGRPHSAAGHNSNGSNGSGGGGGTVNSLFGDGRQAYSMQRGHAGFPQQGQSGSQIPALSPFAQMHGGGHSMAVASFGPNLPPGVTGANERTTLIVSNLNTEEVDPTKLFNLFSNYGNVLRLKLMYNKPDHALIQMADPFQAELAVAFLKGAILFGNSLEVNFSKHSNINMSPDTHDFSNSKLSRFNRVTPKSYKYCCAPTPMIHMSSLPPDITEETIKEHLAAHGNILGVKVYDKDAKKQALVHFSSAEEATEALVCKHASELHGSVVRLAFSKNSNL